MRLLAACLTVVAVVFTSSTVLAEPTKGKGVRVVVPQMRAQRGVEKEFAGVVTEMVLDSLGKLATLEVVEETTAAIELGSAAAKKFSGCEEGDVACILEVGGTLGADYILLSSLASFGAGWRIGFKVVDLKKGVIRAQTGENLARDEETVGRAVCPLVARLLESLARADERVQTTPDRCGGAPPPPVASAPVVEPPAPPPGPPPSAPVVLEPEVRSAVVVPEPPSSMVAISPDPAPAASAPAAGMPSPPAAMAPEPPPPVPAAIALPASPPARPQPAPPVVAAKPPERQEKKPTVTLPPPVPAAPAPPRTPLRWRWWWLAGAAAVAAAGAGTYFALDSRTARAELEGLQAPSASAPADMDRLRSSAIAADALFAGAAVAAAGGVVLFVWRLP